MAQPCKGERLLSEFSSPHCCEAVPSYRCINAFQATLHKLSLNQFLFRTIPNGKCGEKNSEYVNHLHFFSVWSTMVVNDGGKKVHIEGVEILCVLPSLTHAPCETSSTKIRNLASPVLCQSVRCYNK